jgi:hypothetical protein
MMSLKPSSETAWLKEGILAAIEAKPLMVHIRLGDYVLDKRFGNVAEAYYAASIRLLRENGHRGPLWLFSDEPEKALEFLPLEERDRAKAIFPPHSERDPVTSLELMRYGEAYVLSNSTYGWWGASLAYSRTEEVCVPEPWTFHPEPSASQEYRHRGWRGVSRDGQKLDL